MRFQSPYEIDKARIRDRNIERRRNIDTWEIIKNHIPVAYFKKHQYLTDSLSDDIQRIMEIYNVSTPEELVNSGEETELAYYRKSGKLTIDEKTSWHGAHWLPMRQ